MILLFLNYLLELSRVKNEKGYVKKRETSNSFRQSPFNVIVCSTERFPALLFKEIF